MRVDRESSDSFRTSRTSDCRRHGCNIQWLGHRFQADRLRTQHPRAADHAAVEVNPRLRPWDVAELYDLESHPHELHNLFAAPEHHARVMQMDKRLFELLSETGGDSIPLHRGWNGTAKEERNSRQSPWAAFPQSMTIER